MYPIRDRWPSKSKAVVRIGPLKPPPRPLIHAGLYAAWIGITVLFSAILAGGLF